CPGYPCDSTLASRLLRGSQSIPDLDQEVPRLSWAERAAFDHAKGGCYLRHLGVIFDHPAGSPAFNVGDRRLALELEQAGWAINPRRVGSRERQDLDHTLGRVRHVHKVIDLLMHHGC